MVSTLQTMFVFAWLDGRGWTVLNAVHTGSALIKIHLQLIRMENQEYQPAWSQINAFVIVKRQKKMKLIIAI